MTAIFHVYNFNTISLGTHYLTKVVVEISRQIYSLNDFVASKRKTFVHQAAHGF